TLYCSVISSPFLSFLFLSKVSLRRILIPSFSVTAQFLVSINSNSSLCFSNQVFILLNVFTCIIDLGESSITGIELRRLNNSIASLLVNFSIKFSGYLFYYFDNNK